jgi:hypothetical protein
VRGRDHSLDPDRDGRIILKSTLKKWNGGGILDSRMVDTSMLMNCQVLQIQGMPQLAEQLLDSHEGPFSMKLTSAQLG